MERTRRILLAALLLPGMAVAQEQPVAEIGTNLGVTIQRSDGETLTVFGIPGQGILGQPTIYASFFTNSVMVEPQVALNVISGGGETLTTVGLGGQVAYLFNGPQMQSPYVAGTVGFQALSGGGLSGEDFGAGAKVGYRVPVGSSFAVRFEGGYRRWFDTKLNEVSFGVGLGGIVTR